MISQAEIERERDFLKRELAGGTWKGEEDNVKGFLAGLDFVLSDGDWEQETER